MFLHAHPDPREAGSNPGYDPAVLLGPDGADGIILACPGPPGASAALVERTARAAPAALAISAALIERIAPATSATSAIPATSAISAAPAAPATSAAPAKPAPPAGRRIAATLPSVTALGADTSQLTAKAAAVVRGRGDGPAPLSRRARVRRRPHRHARGGQGDVIAGL